MPRGKSLWSTHPDYEVALQPNPAHVRVSCGGVTIADSRGTLLVRETRHDPVVYFPFEDVDFEQLQRTDHETFCPFKGEASYWSILPGGASGENAVWSYEDPFEEVAGLKGYLAFYADRVDWEPPRT